MLICNHWFLAVFTWQSSSRKRKILVKSKIYGQKNFYIRIVSKSCYICILLFVVVYVIVCV